MYIEILADSNLCKYLKAFECLKSRVEILQIFFYYDAALEQNRLYGDGEKIGDISRKMTLNTPIHGRHSAIKNARSCP